MDDKQEVATSPDNATGPQPGTTIVPAGAPRAAEDRVSTLPVYAQPKTPDPQPEPVPVEPIAPPEKLTPIPEEPVAFPEDAQQRPGASTDPNAITWTASEFIAHEKSSSWYMATVGITAAIAIVVYLIFHDLVAASVLIVSGLTLSYYGSRQPRQVQYQIDNQGVTIGQKYYAYGDFKSFAIADDGAFASITLMPLKRFAVQATIYFAPEDEDRIIDTLADYLPFEEHKVDAIDRLMRRIRF